MPLSQVALFLFLFLSLPATRLDRFDKARGKTK